MRKNLILKIFATCCFVIYCLLIVSYIKTDLAINFNTSKKYKKLHLKQIRNKFFTKSAIVNLKQNIKFKKIYSIDKDKRELSNRIISNYYENNLKNKFIFYRNIEEMSDIINYISDADSVEKITEAKDFLPDFITQKKKILYRVKYDSVINYYSKDGELIFREYFIDNKPYRYQSYDKDNNFYTYDKDFQLIEYSKKLKIYNFKGEPLFVSGNVRKKIGGEHQYTYTDAIRTNFIKELNDKNGEIYKSITPTIDKHYSKGSYHEMLSALDEYFEKIKITEPDIYNKYLQAIGDYGMTINFAKTDNGYIFSANQTYFDGMTKIIHSMADKLNIYRGRCAETILKTISKDKVSNRYFYDIKLHIKSDQIKSKEHVPCNTCARNISLWGWKYPKTTVTVDSKRNHFLK